MIKFFAAVSFPLLNIKRDDTVYPDLGGQGYTLIANSCFEAITTNNIENFEDLFTYMLAVGLCAQGGWLNTQIEVEADEQQEVLLNYEIISDILELSGFAIAYSELNNNASLRTAVEGRWNSILSTQTNSAHIIKYLLAMGEIEHPRLSINNTFSLAFSMEA